MISSSWASCSRVRSCLRMGARCTILSSKDRYGLSGVPKGGGSASSALGSSWGPFDLHSDHVIQWKSVGHAEALTQVCMHLHKTCCSCTLVKGQLRGRRSFHILVAILELLLGSKSLDFGPIGLKPIIWLARGTLEVSSPEGE